MIKNSKFNIIYEEILTKNLELQNFKYNFQYDTNQKKLICNFQSVDKISNKLIFIKAITYQESNQTQFKIHFENSTQEKTYTSKEFLLAYYKEYHNFKLAYKVYKNDPNFFKKEEQKQQINDNVPKINSLNEVLQQDENQDLGILIKQDNINFTFKSLNHEKINDLVACTFNIKNNSNVKSSNDLTEYIAVASIKIHEFNSKILSINLFEPENYNSESSEALKNLNSEDFKHKFKTIYYSLIKAIQIYQKKYKNQNIKNI